MTCSIDEGKKMSNHNKENKSKSGHHAKHETSFFSKFFRRWAITAANDLKNPRSGRANFRQITAWVLFSAIIVVFIFWGMSNRGRDVFSVSGGGAARVNHKTISQREVSEVVEQIRENMSKSPYGAFFQGEEGAERLRQMALQQIIQDEVIYQSAQQNRIFVPDASVADLIRNAPPFVEKGQFMRDRYMAFLNQRNMTPTEFEEKIRKSLLSAEMRRLFSGAATASTQEINKELDLKNIKADSEFVKVEIDKLAQKPEDNEKALQELKDILKKSDSTEIEKWVQSHHFKWDTTGSFDIRTSEIPKVGMNEDYANQAFALSSQQKYAKELVRQGGTAFIVKFKAVDTKSEETAKNKKSTKEAKLAEFDKPEFMADNMKSASGNELFMRWLETERKVSTIEIGKGGSRFDQEVPPDFN